MPDGSSQVRFCFIFVFGSETWFIQKRNSQKSQRVQIYLDTRIIGRCWLQHTINTEVEQMLNKSDNIVY